MRSFVVAAALLFVPSLARAEQDFPSAIVSHLGVQCPNPIWDGHGCTVCHRDIGGGCNTAIKPFGVWLKQQGLTCSTLETSKLDELLDQAAADAIDTNCDGVPDVEQLETCQWEALATNDTCDAGTGATQPPPVDLTYGCSQSGSGDGPAGICSVAVAALLLRKRRRGLNPPSRADR